MGHIFTKLEVKPFRCSAPARFSDFVLVWIRAFSILPHARLMGWDYIRTIFYLHCVKFCPGTFRSHFREHFPDDRTKVVASGSP